jgi:DNA primase
MIPDEIVEEVRARADIVEVVGEFVSLKKAGREFKANCPFHEERTPSFHVIPEKGFYTCFGCGKSGDVFSFVMERQGMDFIEAVKHVAGRAGVEVPEVGRSAEQEDPNRVFYEINGLARDWFRAQLLDEKAGASARAYLDSRGIDEEIAERFGLGFAPDKWTALREAAASHGFDDKVMLEAGLIKNKEGNDETYDRFRGRIIFPIDAVSGKVIAFGGRVLEQGSKKAPKYLNSPETPIYRKGHNLYGLSGAKHAIRREERAFVVEGYMDVVSLAAHEFDNVVAPLGTAVTPEQAKLLSRYCKRVLILFDSDPAGVKATFRAGDIFLAAGLHPAVVTLPPGEDPDTIVRTAGPEVLRGHIDDAVDVLDRKLQILDEKDYFSSIEKTRSAVDRLLPTLRSVTDPALRDIYVSKVSDHTGVRRETLEAEMQRGSSRLGFTKSEGRAKLSSGFRPETPSRGAEWLMLMLMVSGAEWVERAVELISAQDFDDPHNRAIFQALVDNPEMRVPSPMMDSVVAQRFDKILSDPERFSHGIEVFTKSVNRIRASVLDRRIQGLNQQIEAAVTDDEKARLTSEKSVLSGELREFDPSYWMAATRGIVSKTSTN